MVQWFTQRKTVVYKQFPKPTDVVGVKVHLTAVDPNGNYQDIGTVTSDEMGNYAVSWKPPVPGLYIVTATFEGSASYYGSQAETAFAVSEAAAAAAPIVQPTVPTETSPATSASPTQGASALPSPTAITQPPPSAMPTTTYIAIGATVIIVIAAAAAALALRKRK